MRPHLITVVAARAPVTVQAGAQPVITTKSMQFTEGQRATAAAVGKCVADIVFSQLEIRNSHYAEPTLIGSDKAYRGLRRSDHTWRADGDRMRS